MIMSTDLYKNILYFEDQVVDSFEAIATAYNISVSYANTAEEGLKMIEENPNKWDAILLDGRMPVNNGEEAFMSTLVHTIGEIKKRYSSGTPPWFVYTAHPEIYIEVLRQEEWQRKNAFAKGVDSEEDLLKNIDDAISNSKMYKFKQVYSKIFDVLPYQTSIDPRYIPTETRLFEIINYQYNEESFNCPMVLNNLRTMLEWVYKYMYHLGLLVDVVPTTTNVAQCSTKCGNKSYVNYIPLYIQRALHTLSDISNEASHGCSTNAIIHEGKAPFLTRSMTYEMLNVLDWIANQPNDDEQINKNRQGMEELTKAIQYYTKKEIKPEIDSNGHVHYEQCIIDEQYNPHERIKITQIIFNDDVNTINDYRYKAVYYSKK